MYIKSLRTVLAVGILAIAIYLLDWASLETAINKISPGPFSVAFLLCLAQFLVMSERWVSILNYADVPSMTKPHAHYLVATFFNNLSPGNLGGDIYRVAAADSLDQGRIKVLICVLKERYLGALCFFVFYLAGFSVLRATGYAATDKPAFELAAIVAAAMTLLLAIAPAVIARIRGLSFLKRLPSVANLLEGTREAVHFKSLRDFIVLFTYSGLGLAIWITAVYVLSVDLGIDTSIWMLMAVATAVEVVRFVPVSIQGIGIREGVFAYLLAEAGQSPEMGFVLGAISYVALSLAMITSGALGWILLQKASATAGKADGRR